MKTTTTIELEITDFDKEIKRVRSLFGICLSLLIVFVAASIIYPTTIAIPLLIVVPVVYCISVESALRVMRFNLILSEKKMIFRTTKN